MQNERMNRKKNNSQSKQREKKKELMNQISFSFHGCIELAMHFFLFSFGNVLQLISFI